MGGAGGSSRSGARGGDLIHWDGGSQKTYRRIIAAMDTQIGRVLAALEENGINRDTIVIFTSDNGGERFSDTWPFTGKKMELLEGGLRIPAIVSCDDPSNPTLHPTAALLPPRGCG